MIRTTVMAVCLCLPALAVAKGKVDEKRLSLLVSIVCENGGKMHTSDAARVLPAQGFTMEETQSLVAELENRGQVVPTAGIATLQLTAAACN